MTTATRILAALAALPLLLGPLLAIKICDSSYPIEIKKYTLIHYRDPIAIDRIDCGISIYEKTADGGPILCRRFGYIGEGVCKKCFLNALKKNHRTPKKPIHKYAGSLSPSFLPLTVCGMHGFRALASTDSSVTCDVCLSIMHKENKKK